jgi:Methyltransferase domain
MLENPSRFAPYPYREDRLDVRWMDARELDLPDESFDAVFSLSSIEHFGGPRVLRRGGYAFVVTECFVRSHPLDSALLQTGIRLATLGRRAPTAKPRKRVLDVFTLREVRSRIVRPSGLRLMQEPSLHLSPETFKNICRWGTNGPLNRRTPHILLQAQGAPWTSVCLALEKPSS